MIKNLFDHSKKILLILLVIVFASSFLFINVDNTYGDDETNSSISLEGDMGFVQNGEFDTENFSMPLVKDRETINLQANLNVKAVFDKMNEILNQYKTELDQMHTDTNQIMLRTSEDGKYFKSSFDVTFDIPENVMSVDTDNITFGPTDKNLFVIGDKKVEGNKLKVTLVLNDKLTKDANNFQALYDLVKNYTPSQSGYYSLIIPLRMELKGNERATVINTLASGNSEFAITTVTGHVEGNFESTASVRPVEKHFKFNWNAIQEPNNKDFYLVDKCISDHIGPEPSADAISASVKIMPTVTVKVNTKWVGTDNLSDKDKENLLKKDVAIQLVKDGNIEPNEILLSYGNSNGSFGELEGKDKKSGDPFKFTVKDKNEKNGNTIIAGKKFDVKYDRVVDKDYITTTITYTLEKAPQQPQPTPQQPQQPQPVPQIQHPTTHVQQHVTPVQQQKTKVNKTKTNKKPATNDTNNIPELLVLALASFGTLAVVIRRKQIKKR